MGGVCIHEAATIGAQLLDAFLGGDRPHRQRLGVGGDGLLHGIAGGIP